VTDQTEKSKVVQRILTALRRWNPPEGVDGPLFRAFAKEMAERIRGPFLAQHHPSEVLSYLEAAFLFALRRPGDAIHVGVERSPQRGVRVVAVMGDQPFIVDTIRLFLRRAEVDYWGGFHVIFRPIRDADGVMIGVGEEGSPESLTLLEGDAGLLRGTDLDEAGGRLRHSLELARATVRDFRPMVRIVERIIERCEGLAEHLLDQEFHYRETAAFLKWLVRENFVFMGLEYEGKRLGVQAIDGPFFASADGEWTLPHPPGTVFVRKSVVESPIHRAGRIDEIRVVIGAGTKQEESLFIRGMFTYRAVTQPSRNVPILRGVLRSELLDQGSEPGSFRYKGIANVFDSLPTEFLFTTPRAAISQMIELVLDSEQQQEVGVTMLRTTDHTAFLLISMPKPDYSEELRRDLEQEVVRGTGATYTDHGLFIGRYETVLLHFYLTGVTKTDRAEVQALTERIRAMATPWISRLWQQLAREVGEERADYLVDTYGRAFPEAWTRRTPVERAVRDIERLDSLPGHEVLAEVCVEGEVANLRVYQSRDVYLTDLLPLLDHMGLTVKSSESVPVRSRGGSLAFDSFMLAISGKQLDRLVANKLIIEACIPAVFERKVDNDPLNKLVLNSSLSWRAVDVLRAYTHYMRQLQIPVAAPRLRSILLEHPQTCRQLFLLFEAKFSPELAEGREALISEREALLEDLLRLLRTHDEDLVLSGIANLIRATVRTNYFREDVEGHYLSFKFDCAKVRDMKGQRPLFEIYVHSHEVEGVHMRFGRVARGGLRWSDRTDYRSEVLGLVTTQQVKNVVIVPEGSKGGFYLRFQERDRAAARAQADRLYRVFVQGLLDLTDNVVAGQVVSPPQVVAWDAPDPYLVVAADKGTAALSDTANEISLAYGFWLGDAFASGGSNGYDHKQVGITARGAWTLVRRHFAELRRDPYKEAFTVVGVGDMGGDVFGNGLIETPHARLLAAFNHAHIFLDPNPDAARSFEERKRLFYAPRAGGWDHYDTSLISEGGGVYDRTSRYIQLSPQAQLMFGIERERVEPEEVIRMILAMDVDLLWSGGIGTYVKATHESHDDADDRSNDRARIDARQLRAKVVGEGANLSFTQAARIEAGLRGVALNTDFIDNSAGVDMSDHEVNLKILINAPMARGELDEAGRNELLRSLTEEVAELVLLNNEVQGRQLSRDRIRSKQDIFPFARAISFIERVWGFDRAALQLPNEAVLLERAEAGAGLTRPELATLSAHVKRWVYAELIASGKARQLSSYDATLMSYFPKALQERYPQDIREHQLADEIAMTMLTTRLVGDTGASFVPLLAESSGRSVMEIADAYLRSQRLARAYATRSTLEELRTTVSLDALYRAWVRVDAGCREVTAYWLEVGNRPPTDSELSSMSEAVDQVYALQADDMARRQVELVRVMRADDIPANVAELVLKAGYLNIALMVWSNANKLNVSLAETVVRQLAAGRATRLQEVIDSLSTQPALGEWSPIAMRVFVDRFGRVLRDVVRRLGAGLPAKSVDELEPLLERGPLRALREQVDRLLPRGAPADVAALVVLEERLRGIVDRLGA
jgi:glutamate dehydrogenase